MVFGKLSIKFIFNIFKNLKTDFLEAIWKATNAQIVDASGMANITIAANTEDTFTAIFVDAKLK